MTPMFAFLLCGLNAGEVEVLAHVPGVDAVDAARRGVRLCALPEFHAEAKIARAWFSPDVAHVDLGVLNAIVVPVDDVARFKQVALREATTLL